ncbi:hypothetical protein KC968_04315 [Candidatus Saccharibacteria bacterium]|nr:hypothetical protein [Candidatus Saccharibacteria bacterium]
MEKTWFRKLNNFILKKKTPLLGFTVLEVFILWVVINGGIVAVILTRHQSPTTTQDNFTSSNYENKTTANTDNYSSEPRSQSTSNSSFEGYDCTSDCSGHEAGYDWAEENDICSTYSSGDEYDEGNSNSFNEGVTAYIDDNC